MLASRRAPAVITLYHCRYTRSVRVRWLLEELGLPFDLMTLAVEELCAPEYDELLPLARVPVLADDKLILCESGAIVQYLLETYGYGRLEPSRGSSERPAYLQWFHFAEASLGQPLAAITEHTRRLPGKLRIPAVVVEAKNKASRALGVLERALQEREWLTSQFSAADIMMGWSAVVAQRHQLVTSEFPSVKAYVARCHQRSLFRRSMYT
jgi:glutathione S-transferase